MKGILFPVIDKYIHMAFLLSEKTAESENSFSKATFKWRSNGLEIPEFCTKKHFGSIFPSLFL